MSFLRHGESIDPMIGLPLGASSCAHSQRSSASMSSSRLFLGRLLSSRARLRFVGWQQFSETEPRRTMIFQRAAITSLTSCLSPRVQSMASSIPLIHPSLQDRQTVRTCHSRWNLRLRLWPICPVIVLGLTLLSIHSGQRCSLVLAAFPQKMQWRIRRNRCQENQRPKPLHGEP
jgi:hypothetical protein